MVFQKLLHVLQLLVAPDALEKASLEEQNDTSTETIKELIRTKRRGLFFTLPWIFIPATLGIITAQVINYLCIVPSNYLPWIRGGSLSIFAFATLSRLEEVRTFDGNTLPEKANTFLFKFTYSIGFLLTIFSLFLDIH